MENAEKSQWISINFWKYILGRAWNLKPSYSSKCRIQGFPTSFQDTVASGGGLKWSQCTVFKHFQVLTFYIFFKSHGSGESVKNSSKKFLFVGIHTDNNHPDKLREVSIGPVAHFLCGVQHFDGSHRISSLDSFMNL